MRVGLGLYNLQTFFWLIVTTNFSLVQFSSVAQSCLTLCNPWIAARQASLSITNSQSLLKLTREYITPWLTLGLCQKLPLSPLYFNETLLHKSYEQSSLISGPRLNSSPLEAKNQNAGVIMWFSNNISGSQCDIRTFPWERSFVFLCLSGFPMVWFTLSYKSPQGI